MYFLDTHHKSQCVHSSIEYTGAFLFASYYLLLMKTAHVQSMFAKSDYNGI